MLAFLVSMMYVFGGDIKVAVAANVSYAMNDLKKEFHQINPDIQVDVIVGSSGKLTAQIMHGAPFDLFLSANMKFPIALYNAQISKHQPVIYAEGTLALFSTKAKDFSDNLAVLKHTDIRKIAIANPKTAPYGLAAKEALENAKLYALLKEKFVYGESIAQTVSYAATSADIGLIAKSSLFSPQMNGYKEYTNWITVNKAFYTPISQGMVRLNDKAEVKAFYDFILSPQARKILQSFGYTVK